MIIKKYIVTDMREAMIRAKYELGKDAVIISERQIKEGLWFNPFKKTKLEVTVALEEDSVQPAAREQFNKVNLAKKSYSEHNQLPEKQKTENIENNQIIFNIIKNNEFKVYCDKHCEKDEIITKKHLKDFIQSEMPNNCFNKDFEFADINALVGPTGVGKTTTIAKIASKEYLVNRKKVGLITMDTYRIGAVEQLKTYASILGIPCEVAEKPEDMQKKIDKLSYCDLLLIDTVGTSHNNKEKLDDIHNFLTNSKQKINKYLVLSISTDKEVIKSVFDKYLPLDYDALVLTKLDEVSSFNNFWDITENNTNPIQYFCYGQNVPEDIQLASLDNVLSYLWGELM